MVIFMILGKIIVNIMPHVMDDNITDSDVKNANSFVCDCTMKCRPCVIRA